MSDTRAEFDSLVGRAFQIVVDTIPEDTIAESRPYTAEELEELMFNLTLAAAKLKKLPGGREAAEHVYERAQAELNRRATLT